MHQLKMCSYIQLRKKFFVTFLIFCLLLFLLVTPISSLKEKSREKIEKSVLSALKSGPNNSIILIIELNESALGNNLSKKSLDLVNLDFNFSKKQIRKYKNIIVANITSAELEHLVTLESISYIREPLSFKSMLQNTTSQINASSAWLLQENSFNLTGTAETVCVIDTGIDFMHPALIGKNRTCLIDCFEKTCSPNCSIRDDSGHGTHVAGIIAASGPINGVAPNASLIALKVLDANGDASPYTAEIDIANAIDWCSENKDNYNISVISLSLGTTAPNLYSNFCDSYSPVIFSAINSATTKNISVVAAAGNNGNKTHISLPACMSKAIPVGSIRKNDLTIDFNRNHLVKLLAPGVSINSTWPNSGYILSSGTSMSTPHVSGAIALINQYLKLTNQKKSPFQIESALNLTGKKVYDSAANLNFSRINIYDAIIFFDKDPPKVNLIYPPNNYNLFGNNQTFKCNSFDLSLSNATFFLWNSTSIYNTTSISINGSNRYLEVNLSNIPYGNYLWNCQYFDEKGNSAFHLTNFSFSIQTIVIDLHSPTNNEYTNKNKTFVCNANSTSELANATFLLWNSSSDLIFSKTFNVSGYSNYSEFEYNFSTEGRFFWNCKFTNVLNIVASANSNYSINYDITPPIYQIIKPLNNTWNNGEFNVSLNEAGNCNYSLDEGLTNISMSSFNSTYFYSENKSLSNENEYSLMFFCKDLAGNENFSSPIVFKFDSIPPNITLISPANGDSSFTGHANVDFVYSVADNLGIISCFLILEGSENLNIQNTSEINNHSNTISLPLAAGTYNWSVKCTDVAGNTGSSLKNLLQINSQNAGSSPSGGGRGSSSSSLKLVGFTNTRFIDLESFYKGYNILLSINETVNFTINSTGRFETHSLTVRNLTEEKIDLTIRSAPLEVLLLNGRSKKLNISSPIYYDLYLEFHGKALGKANLTIKGIYEEIIARKETEVISNLPISDLNKDEEKYEIESKTPQDKVDIKNGIEVDTEKNQKSVYSIVLGILIVLFILIFMVFLGHITHKLKKLEKLREEHKVHCFTAKNSFKKII